MAATDKDVFLDVTVLDHDLIGKDDQIGYTKIKVEDFPAEGMSTPRHSRVQCRCYLRLFILGKEDVKTFRLEGVKTGEITLGLSIKYKNAALKAQREAKYKGMFTTALLQSESRINMFLFKLRW